MYWHHVCREPTPTPTLTYLTRIIRIIIGKLLLCMPEAIIIVGPLLLWLGTLPDQPNEPYCHNEVHLHHEDCDELQRDAQQARQQVPNQSNEHVETTNHGI